MNNNEYDYSNEERQNIDEKIVQDLAYIANEVIAKQKDGNYCKWSRILKSVSIVGLTEKQMVEYWKGQYKNYKEYQQIIEDACINKLHNDLITVDEMIYKIKNSRDTNVEKERAILALTGKTKLSDNISRLPI